MLDPQGGVFPCHKTTDFGNEDDYIPGKNPNERHCAGALIFAERHGNCTQMMRIAERLRFYDHTKLKPHEHLVFDSVEEMRKAVGLREPVIGTKHGKSNKSNIAARR